MEDKFEKRSREINEKKFLITEKYIFNLCDKEKLMSDKKIRRLLKSYAKKMSKLEMKKYDFFRFLKYKDTKSSKEAEKGNCFCALEYGKKYKYSHLRKKGIFANNSAVMYINYKRFSDNIKSGSKEEKCKVFFKYIESVHHELGHLEQYVAINKFGAINDISSAEALKYGLETSLNDYEEKDYKKSLMEENARYKGLKAITDIFKGKDKYEDYVTYMIKKRNDENPNDFFVELEGENEKEIYCSRSISYVKEIDSFCPTWKAIFTRNQPVLRKLYNKTDRLKMCDLVEKYMDENAKLSENKHLSDEEKHKKIKDIKDLYSEIFLISLNSSEDCDITQTKEKIGDEAFESIIHMTKEYCNERYNYFNELAKKKYLIREEIYGNTPDNLELYNNIVKSIDCKYKPIFQKMSNLEQQYIGADSTKKDDLNIVRVNEELSKKYSSNKSEKNLYQQELSDKTQNTASVDIAKMRDVRDEYKEFEGLLFGELEETKKEYYDILELNKNKELVQDNKEM